MGDDNKAIIFVPKRTCLFFGNNGRGQQRWWQSQNKRGRWRRERNAIREEQGKYKPRARDTSHWHLFWPPREKKQKTTCNETASRKKWNASHVKMSCLVKNLKRQDWSMRPSPFFFVCLNAHIIRGRRMDRTCFPTGRASGLGHLDLVSKATTTYWLLSRLLHVCSSFIYPGWVEKVWLFRVGQKTANCALWQEWKLYPLDRQAWT